MLSVWALFRLVTCKSEILIHWHSGWGNSTWNNLPNLTIIMSIHCSGHIICVIKDKNIYYSKRNTKIDIFVCCSPLIQQPKYFRLRFICAFGDLKHPHFSPSSANQIKGEFFSVIDI